MELPFTIKFFKKLEYFQDFKRMECHALNQQCGNNLNIWGVEKKVLRWLYPGHKHFGSPILIQHFLKDDEAAKKHFIYNFDLWITQNEKELQKLILIESSESITKKRKQLNDIRDWKSGIQNAQIWEIENEFKYSEGSEKKRKIFDNGCIFDYNFKEKISKISGKDSLYLSEEEKMIAAKEVRNILKNLVAKDFAKFSNEQNEVDGISITPNGLLMGEVIWECTDIDLARNKLDICRRVYYLIYSNWNILGWVLVSSGILFAVSSILEKFELWGAIIITIKSIIHYNNSLDIYIAWLFIFFALDVVFLSVFSCFRFFLGNHKQNK